MIVYHGTPIGGPRIDVVRFLSGRHALIPWKRPEDLESAKECCQTFVVDNSAFSAWKSGSPIDDWTGYYEWVISFYRHPAFRWAIIPDVIDGDEEQNDQLLDEWPDELRRVGNPVWHLHESLDRLERIIDEWDRFCLGSSGEYHQPGSDVWRSRMREAMEVICDNDGYPRKPGHGLRMAAPGIATKYPFSSVDSTNVAQNAGGNRTYSCVTNIQRAELIASRMEHEQSPGVFTFSGQLQETFQLEY